jgi:hypothetical protein
MFNNNNSPSIFHFWKTLNKSLCMKLIQFKPIIMDATNSWKIPPYKELNKGGKIYGSKTISTLVQKLWKKLVQNI